MLGYILGPVGYGFGCSGVCAYALSAIIFIVKILFLFLAFVIPAYLIRRFLFSKKLEERIIGTVSIVPFILSLILISGIFTPVIIDNLAIHNSVICISYSLLPDVLHSYDTSRVGGQIYIVTENCLDNVAFAKKQPSLCSTDKCRDRLFEEAGATNNVSICEDLAKYHNYLFDDCIVNVIVKNNAVDCNEIKNTVYKKECIDAREAIPYGCMKTACYGDGVCDISEMRICLAIYKNKNSLGE